MFKESFKYYKSKKPPPSLNDVVDFDDISKWLPVIKQHRLNSNIQIEPKFGLKTPDTWELYELLSSPGLVFIKNPFTAIGQRYWTVRCLRDYPFAPNRTNLREQSFELSKSGKTQLPLRWTTLGYQYDWDSKVYSEELKNVFPEDLAKLSRILGEVLGFENFCAQAAIVNYYYFNSTLSGHTDHSEDNLEAPLFSFSFGQSAIFLLGGKTLDEKPIPIFIRSGDIIAMTKQARLCYHGIPKILEERNSIDRRWRHIDLNEEFYDEHNVLQLCIDTNCWLPYGKFLENSRINVNVRQVLKESQLYLSN
ncbi:hypothetical protein HHI36_010745 [Cryptolaemus montrouzieri]|uniref:Fe2OG dioxygenase domain-containing protein n=1 Tax=Cryptolaemus montrouzieri TaxID=559131 RepID=A0ABD2MJL7_9CUCU